MPATGCGICRRGRCRCDSHPAAHLAGLPAGEADDGATRGLPEPVASCCGGGRRRASSLGQGGAYWVGVERVLNTDRWIEARSRSSVPHERPHLRRRPGHRRLLRRAALQRPRPVTMLPQSVVGTGAARTSAAVGNGAVRADTNGGKTARTRMAGGATALAPLAVPIGPAVRRAVPRGRTGAAVSGMASAPFHS
jgi:hypothetical protein